MSGVIAQSAVGSFMSAADIDLRTSEGIQNLLKALRGAPLSQDDYNELRDLIITYKQQGDLPEGKAKILNLLAECGLIENANLTDISDPAVNKIPIKVEKSEETKPTPTNAENQVAEIKTPVSAEVGHKSMVGRPKPTFGLSKTKPVIKELVADLIPQTQKEVELSIKKETEVAASPQVSKTAVKEEPIIPVVKETVPVTNPEPKPAEVVTYSDPEERIRFIKQQVNQKVGNPVNLIDTNNEVGREYMNALLEAMKKVNGGSSGDVNVAMDRLELAFTAVEKALKDTPVKNTIELESVVENKAVPETESAKVQESNDSESKKESPAEIQPLSSPYTPSSKSLTVDLDNNSPADNIPIPHKALPKNRLFTPLSEEVTVSREKTPPQSEAVEESSGVYSNGVSPKSGDVIETEDGKLQSVAKAKQLQNILHANMQKEAEEAKEKHEAELAAMDPLDIPSITSGLEQLLSEWNLFKSSGIFGTGPSGMEHPLYRQLANLQMSSVIAGRFEGATSEVKQSIADYMNGWRYEEGIIHQHGETFEHYLRRVIKKILGRKAV